MRLLLLVLACLSNNAHAGTEVVEGTTTKSAGKKSLQMLLYARGPMRYNSQGRRGQDFRSYEPPRGQYARDYSFDGSRGQYDRDYLPGPRGDYDRDYQPYEPRGQYERDYPPYGPRGQYDRDHHSYGPRGQYDRDYQSDVPSDQYERDYGWSGDLAYTDRYEPREMNYYSDRDNYDYYDEPRRDGRFHNRGNIYSGANMASMGGRTLRGHGSDYTQQYYGNRGRRPFGNRGDNSDANADLPNEQGRNSAYTRRN